MNEAIAKHVIACNACNAEIGKHYPEGHKNISVALLSQPEANGGTYKETHHFCDEACLATFLNAKTKSAIASFTALAKAITQCDNCKTNLNKEDGDKKQNIQATLANGKDENQQYHYCDEECLRQHLNARAKRKRERSSASFVGEGAYFASANILALDVAEDEAFARYISSKKRGEMKDSDFLDPERRSFPIKNCEDVKAAVHAWGRYKGSMSFEEFKSKLTRKAHALGCSLPEKWDEEKK